MFIIDDKFKKIINYQVTTTPKDMSFYTTLSENEYEILKLFLQPFPKRILELGCGLGRMSIFINKMNPSESKYYLADSTKIDTIDKTTYGWNPGSWYNDLELTKEFCEINGLTNIETIDLTKQSLKQYTNIDLVFSVMSVGFHYPLEDYLPILKQIVNSDGIMIFGVRRGVYESASFLSDFNFFQFYTIPNETKEKFLVLKGWK